MPERVYQDVEVVDVDVRDVFAEEEGEGDRGSASVRLHVLAVEEFVMLDNEHEKRREFPFSPGVAERGRVHQGFVPFAVFGRSHIFSRNICALSHIVRTSLGPGAKDGLWTY